MQMCRWALCAALVLGGVACGDDDGGEKNVDASVADPDGGIASGGNDAAQTTSDAATAQDAASDASMDSSAKDAGPVPAVGELPVLPIDAKNLIIINVTGSNSKVLADGTYQAPYQKNASQGSSVSFLDSSYIFSMMPSLQVQMTMKREMKDGSFTCEKLTTVIVRYGKPPSGNNQLVARSCNVEFSYDAATLTYTGTIRAKVSDGLLEADEPESDLLGRFTWTES